MRKIGLDIGSKSCGVAISDALNLTAQGKANLFFADKKWDELLQKLQPFFVEYQIDVIVIGYPTFPSGDKSSTTLMIEEVAEVIKNHFKINTVFVSEDDTTNRAFEILEEMDIPKDKWKDKKDEIAAVLILEDYLIGL